MKKVLLSSVFLFIFLTAYAHQHEASVVVQAPQKVEVGETFTVKLTIRKNEASGFARLQIDFPSFFNVKSDEKAGATFSYQNGNARFLWVSLPDEEEVKVVCIVTSHTAGYFTYQGSFSFIIDNETQRINIPAQKLVVGDLSELSAKQLESFVISKEKPRDTARKEAVATPETKAEKLELKRIRREEAQRKKPEVVMKEDLMPEKDMQAKEITEEPQEKIKEHEMPHKRIIGSARADYRIQIAALRKPVKEGYFNRLEDAFSEHDIVYNKGPDGWYRYTIGSFTALEEAQNLLNQITAMGYDAFITAYKGEKRISIDEAQQILGR